MDYLNADGLGIKHFGSQIKAFWGLRCASRFLLLPPAHLIDFPHCHSCEGRNLLFPIEIRTISPIISLKRAEFLVLMGNSLEIRLRN